jgi:hypothetical protein
MAPYTYRQNYIRFFVTGHGRSGTKWLTLLLNRCDSTVAVHHEPLPAFDKRRYWQTNYTEYLAEREIKMKERHGGDKRDWAEVNSYLRYCVPQLREMFDVPVATLIRDGRYVVRSMLARDAYRLDGYPEVDAPDELETPFEKCCWYWAHTYRDHDAPVWRLEDLNASYETFERLCDYLGMTPDRDTWAVFIGRRVNAIVDDPTLPAWGEEQQATFDRLAGDVQGLWYAD